MVFCIDIFSSCYGAISINFRMVSSIESDIFINYAIKVENEDNGGEMTT